MKTVADVLGVSRSNLAERLKGKCKPRGSYLKADDAELLPAIRKLVDARRPMAIGGSLPFSTGSGEPPICPSSIASEFIASWPITL